jgi:uncharacterized protein YkwD
MNPKLFASTYAVGYKGANGFEKDSGFDANEKSLITALKSLDSLSVLSPNKEFYNYAQCQAAGIISHKLFGTLDAHNRTITGFPDPGNYTENVYSANISPLDIIMGWLNDAGNIEGSSQLGHRENCLNPSASSKGVSIMSFGTSNQTAVMDLSFN